MINLPELPYSLDALEPYVSAETMKFHRTKHHQGYVTNLNALIKDTEYEDADLDHIVRESSGPIFNNAAQVWNHTFYFEGLAPQPDGGENSITNEVTEYLSKHFQNPANFMDEFTKASKGLFGSGWVWLFHHEDGIGRIRSYSNADSPFTTYKEGSVFPLLCWDCWEHNYYIDHRNDRGAALNAFWKVVNWKRVTKLLENT